MKTNATEDWRRVINAHHALLLLDKMDEMRSQSDRERRIENCRGTRLGGSRSPRSRPVANRALKVLSWVEFPVSAPQTAITQRRYTGWERIDCRVEQSSELITFSCKTTALSLSVRVFLKALHILIYLTQLVNYLLHWGEVCPPASSKHRAPHRQNSLEGCKLKDRGRYVFSPQQIPEGSATGAFHWYMLRELLQRGFRRCCVSSTSGIQYMPLVHSPNVINYANMLCDIIRKFLKSKRSKIASVT